jgi:hypothetical protein
VTKYPWFALPRFLRLKVHEQLEKTPETTELNRAVVFSSDREHLYRWIRGEVDSMIETTVPGGTEIEFLDSPEKGGATDEEGHEAEDREGDEDAFVLLDDEEDDAGNEDNEDSVDEDDKDSVDEDDKDSVDEDDEDSVDEDDEDSGNDADAKPIPEKDETEMEEPEIEEPEAVPVMDPLDDDDDEDDGENGEEIEEKHVAEDVEETAKPSVNLIERFLESEPGAIKADKQTSLEGDVSVGSVQEDDSYITDTLAKIYVKQGLHAKAIYAYERLSLKYPEKSAYFAAQIEKIKNNANV